MIPETLREAARRFGDSVAYVTPQGWPITYGELDRTSDEAAVGLRRRGVSVGDVVSLVLPPGIEYLVAYLAVAKVGAITAGVNDKLAAPERAKILELAGPALVLAAPGSADSPFPTEVYAPAESIDALLTGLRVAGDAPPVLPDDPDRAVAIVFTSGTTGTPKGALYGNRQLRFITDTDVGDGWGTGGKSYNGTSSATLGFMSKLPGNLRRGGTAFMMARWSARATLELIARERMTSIGGVPTQLALMLRDPDFDAYDLSSVRAIISGGAPMTPSLAAEARARFHAPLATRYSCTEAGIGLGTAFDDPDEDAVVSVGRPLPGVELVLLDDDHPVPAGEVGAVCLRSPAAMTGYWKDPEGTRAAFTDDGFVRTGDLGWVDDRGRLRLVGRHKEMYVRGGYNVYPVEVEAVLSTAPDVAAVAIATRPDELMGEIGVACVVPRDPADPPTLERLRAFAGDQLAKHKLPEAVVVVDALPLTAAEKVDRRALARLANPDS
ncbi:MAG: class I adenylate-forming enzyme family protein [Acidimicrobiia bacterium]|jgi:acyl-CoA synthetase (AMP-forming)/AMP-acid ligase II